MFTKCQLLHIDRLKPESVSDLDLLLSTLETSVVFFILKSVTNNAYDISEIYCNRKPATHQREITADYNKFATNPEMFTVNQAIALFVGNIIDSYYIAKQSDPTRMLNIEISLLTRHNIAISYDLF